MVIPSIIDGCARLMITNTTESVNNNDENIELNEQHYGSIPNLNQIPNISPPSSIPSAPPLPTSPCRRRSARLKHKI